MTKIPAINRLGGRNYLCRELNDRSWTRLRVKCEVGQRRHGVTLSGQQQQQQLLLRRHCDHFPAVLFDDNHLFTKNYFFRRRIFGAAARSFPIKVSAKCSTKSLSVQMPTDSSWYLRNDEFARILSSSRTFSGSWTLLNTYNCQGVQKWHDQFYEFI